MAALPGRTGADRFAGEQAALRRVATLVARAASPEEVFAAVTEEAGRLLEADFTLPGRYGAPDPVTVLGNWARADTDFPSTIGRSVPLGGNNVHTLVARTRRPA